MLFIYSSTYHSKNQLGELLNGSVVDDIFIRQTKLFHGND